MSDNFAVDQILDTAVARHEAGELDLAEAGYRTVLQANPNEPDALNLLGVILQERGDLAGSIELINRALTILPEFPEALTNLARAHRAAGALGSAEDATRRAIALDPDQGEAHLQLGCVLLDLNDNPGATEALRRATTLAPKSMDAWRYLGVALMRLNDLTAAADALTTALALDPPRDDVRTNIARTLADLSRLHRTAGDGRSAVGTARRAAALDPALADAQLQLGYALLDQQDEAAAIHALRRAAAMAPKSTEALVGLATALTRRKDHAAAAEAWQAALALQPADAGLLIGFAAALAELERFDEALATFRDAAALAPDDPRVQFGIALCLMHIGDDAAATEVCRRATQTTPDWPAMWQLLAACEAKLGNFDQSIKSYRRTLALAPESADALHDLVVVGSGLDNDEATKTSAQNLLDDKSRPTQDRVAGGFALGQVCDRQGAYTKAFAAYASANQLLRDDWAARGILFDRKSEQRRVDWRIDTIEPRAFAATAGWGDPSEVPVFIVGMPRSGTSLVEQIAASHGLVFGAGERKDIANILMSLGRDPATGRAMPWDRESVRRLAAAHVGHLRHLGEGAIRVIDKMPHNIMFLGQIAMLFPRARIVVCQRDPRDSCLSCFFQYFRDEALVWSHDLGDCGFVARQTDRLMQHWRKVLPIPMLEIQYETLVGDLENESRRLIEFLGLEWDPACLMFHQTARSVRTASYKQVRKPLYASAIGRWRRYSRHLGPLLAELQGLVPADGSA